MTIREQTSTMRGLLESVLANEPKETTSYMSALQTAKLYEHNTLNESEYSDDENYDEEPDIDEDGNEIVYNVTEGWDNDDEIIQMFESIEQSDNGYLIENAGNLAGLDSHVIRRITGKDGWTPHKGGQNSPVETVDAKNKNVVHKTISQAMASNHVIVKHNGKVIATSHPTTDNEPRSKSVVLDANGNKATETKWENRKHREYSNYANKFRTVTRREPIEHTELSKGAALDHIHNAIHKAGGFDGNHVEIHIIGKDRQRIATQNSRHDTKKMNYEHPKALSTIAGKAAEKILAKTPNHAMSQHNEKLHAAQHEVANTAAELNHHIKSGDHSAIAKTAEALQKHAATLHHLARSAPSDYAHGRVISTAKEIGKSQNSGQDNAATGYWDSREFKHNLKRIRSGE